ncbi:UNVERIFIED_CONTAM: hypothetical protein IGO34_33495, partial [Salmonella enterica subsp. enterica serovar Weltevreden]
WFGTYGGGVHRIDARVGRARSGAARGGPECRARSPAFHARDFYEGVKGKVPAKFELIPDMPHSMPWYPRHQKVMLGLIERFLAE